MEEKQFEVSFDMRNKFALQMLHVTLPSHFVDKINNFIDGKVENLDVIRQNSDSKYPPGIDLDIGLTEDNQDVKLLKSTLDTICGEYLRQIGHGDSHVDVFESWSILSYAGDYNPLHDHDSATPAGLSTILYLKVPECIRELPDPDDMLVFPSWLKHAVMPFYGDGERRIISANANVIPPEMFDWKNKSDEERQQVIKDLRSVKTKR